MADNQKNRRIVTNTLILYVRMAVITIISLYSSRIVLQLLGLQDFGIFHVVAGIVEFAIIFTGTLTSATQRFLSFELGRNDLKAFNLSFCSLYNIIILLCVILLFVLIIAGIWLVHDVLDIPATRRYAATWVLICAILSFILSTLAIPYVSAIIAYELMDIYAYISIVETIFKLLAILLLFLYDGDKLIAYSIAILILRGFINLAISLYCKKHIEGCNYHFVWNKDNIKQLASYSGWTLIGAISYTLTTQGHSILLNLFFGPIINAAKGISDRVKNYALMFSQNILMAITPQLTKSYAANDIQYTKNLVIESSRFSFFLMLFLSFPLIMEMQSVLILWLGTEYVTSETIAFSVNCLIFVLISTIEAPLTKTIQANGNVKSYEIVVGSITLLFIPISYILLKYNDSANSTFILLNILYIIILFYRVYRVKFLINMSYYQYIRNMVFPILKVCFALTLIALLQTRTPFIQLPIFLRIFIWYAISLIVIIFIGFSTSERKIIYNFIKHDNI